MQLSSNERCIRSPTCSAREVYSSFQWVEDLNYTGSAFHCWKHLWHLACAFLFLTLALCWLWCVPNQVSGLSLSTFQALVWYLDYGLSTWITPSPHLLGSHCVHAYSFLLLSQLLFCCLPHPSVSCHFSRQGSCCFYKPPCKCIAPPPKKLLVPFMVYIFLPSTCASLPSKGLQHTTLCWPIA